MGVSRSIEHFFRSVRVKMVFGFDAINGSYFGRTLHVAVNQDHYFEGCILTARFSHGDRQIDAPLDQINTTADHFLV